HDHRTPRRRRRGHRARRDGGDERLAARARGRPGARFRAVRHRPRPRRGRRGVAPVPHGLPRGPGVRAAAAPGARAVAGARGGVRAGPVPPDRLPVDRAARPAADGQRAPLGHRPRPRARGPRPRRARDPLPAAPPPVSVADGGWELIAPSPIPFGDLTPPREAGLADLDEVVAAFAHAARMSDLAGYEVVEIHASHGYLLHQFLSPLANRRTDEHGGSLQNRMRFPLRVARAVREAFPAHKPVFVRITATDWVEGGITLEEAATFAKELAAVGVDLLDVTSGVLVRDLQARPPARTGVNVGFASALREASGLAVAPVGQIVDLQLAHDVIDAGTADAVLVGRPLLRDPYLALRNRPSDPAAWPAQYHRAL